MSKKLKICLTTLFSCLLLISSVIFLVTMDNSKRVYATNGTESVSTLQTFEMKVGAGVKVGQADPTATGMSFTALISKTEFDNLAGNVYVGIVIAPDFYACDDAHDLTESNVFGEDGVSGDIYYFNDNVVTGEKDVNGRYEIWNLDGLPKVDAGEFYSFTGRVTNFADNQAGVLRQYVARGYICQDIEGVKTYKMANYFDDENTETVNRDNNTRSMFSVAKSAYDANDASLANETVKANFKIKYIDNVTQLIDGYKSLNVEDLFGVSVTIDKDNISSDESKSVKVYMAHNAVANILTETVTAEFELKGENNDILGLKNDWVSASPTDVKMEYGFQNELLVVSLSADNGANIKLPVKAYERIISTPEDFIAAFTVKSYFNSGFDTLEKVPIAGPSNTIVNWVMKENGDYAMSSNKYVVDYSRCLNAGYYILTNTIDMTGYEYKHEVMRDFIKMTGASKNEVLGNDSSFFYNNLNGSQTYGQLIGFKGTFEGNGFEVKNLVFPERIKYFNDSVNITYEGGIFGQVNIGSVIKNVSFRNVLYPYSVEYGGLFGSAICDSTLENIYVSMNNLSKGYFYTARKAERNTVKNVVFDYSRHQTFTSNAHRGSFGFEAGSLVDEATSKNVFVLSEIPLSVQSDKNTIRKDAYNISLSDLQYSFNGAAYADSAITIQASYAKETNVLRFAKAQGLIDYIAENNISLTDFSDKYWDISSGMPVWKGVGT